MWDDDLFKLSYNGSGERQREILINICYKISLPDFHLLKPQIIKNYQNSKENHRYRKVTHKSVMSFDNRGFIQEN
jgi:hypothetical protein